MLPVGPLYLNCSTLKALLAQLLLLLILPKRTLILRIMHEKMQIARIVSLLARNPLSAISLLLLLLLIC
jgi:hypothetical protein